MSNTSTLKLMLVGDLREPDQPERPEHYEPSQRQREPFEAAGPHWRGLHPAASVGHAGQPGVAGGIRVADVALRALADPSRLRLVGLIAGEVQSGVFGNRAFVAVPLEAVNGATPVVVVFGFMMFFRVNTCRRRAGTCPPRWSAK